MIYDGTRSQLDDRKKLLTKLVASTASWAAGVGVICALVVLGLNALGSHTYNDDLESYQKRAEYIRAFNLVATDSKLDRTVPAERFMSDLIAAEAAIDDLGDGGMLPTRLEQLRVDSVKYADVEEQAGAFWCAGRAGTDGDECENLAADQLAPSFLRDFRAAQDGQTIETGLGDEPDEPWTLPVVLPVFVAYVVSTGCLVLQMRYYSDAARWRQDVANAERNRFRTRAGWTKFALLLVSPLSAIWTASAARSARPLKVEKGLESLVRSAQRIADNDQLPSQTRERAHALITKAIALTQTPADSVDALEEAIASHEEFAALRREALKELR